MHTAAQLKLQLADRGLCHQ